ncbi:uncharacterized protein LOC141629641 [Silene latifolia]|uniref:uncharacterized protein LOC141629641 n=1 Tax=Silene latifolia TaxID=37657 RepID=UPI003D77BAE7
MGRPKKLAVTVLQPRQGRSGEEPVLTTPIGNPNSVNRLISTAFDKSAAVRKTRPATPGSSVPGKSPLVSVTLVGMELRSIRDSNPSGEVVIEVDDIQSELDYWQNTLVGQFLGGQAIYHSGKDFVTKHWNHVSKPSVLYFKNGWFYFRFSPVEDMNTILRGPPWNLNGHSLLLKQWTPTFPTQLHNISKVPVWVLFHNLDPHLWSASALSKIASKIGSPLYADPVTTNKERLSFARVMVEVELSEPLPDNVVINSPFMGQIIQDVEYEWLPYYCTHCKKLGHEKRVCKQLKQHTKVTLKSDTQEGKKLSETNIVPETVVDDTLGDKALTTDSGEGCQPEPVVSDFVTLLSSERVSLVHPSMVVTEQQPQSPIPVSLNQFGVLEDSEHEEATTILTSGVKKGFVVQRLSIQKGVTWAEQEVQNTSSQWIHLLITQGAHILETTFVYGFNHPSQRLPLWDFLVSKAGCASPWIVLGDVNCVRTVEERISSDPPNIAAMNDFNETVANSGLAELRTQGCCFTWTNKQDHEERKWVKLDRVLVNAHWLMAFPDSYVEAFTAEISDHSPLVVSLMANEPARKYSFKYLNFWGQDKNFKALIGTEWVTRIKGCAMYSLVQHLKNLKEQLQLDPHNRDLSLKEEHLSKDYCHLRQIELSIAFQRAKDFDIRKGDASTAYFSSKVAAKRNYANIRRVVDQHGSVFTNSQDISKSFIDYYISLLGSTEAVTEFDPTIMQNGHILSPSESCRLLEPITPSEIKAAFFSIDANKSPGPDGYTSGFFKDAWDTIKDSFIAAISDFFSRLGNS